MASLSLPIAIVPDRVSAWLAGRRAVEPMAFPVYGALMFAAVIVVLAIASGRFGFDPDLFADGSTTIVFVLLIACGIRIAGFARLATGVEMATLTVAIPIVLAFSSLVLASSALPLRDRELMLLDSWLFGFDRNAVIVLARRSDWLMTIAGWVYDSLALTPQLLLVALIATKRLKIAWTVMTALTLAAIVAMLIMPLVPALGTAPYPYRFQEIFEAVRSGELRHFDGAAITGLVTFPSVHAADGVILAWGFSRLGRWAFPMVVLNILMVGSALLIGGHYLVDLIAGVAMAVVVLKLSSALVTRFERNGRVVSASDGLLPKLD